jgi:predicted ATPase
MNCPKTNWYVLTGRPCSGLSTTLEALRRTGFPVMGEAARAVIDEKLSRGLTIGEIRRDDAAFQREILERKRAIESGLAPEEVRFLDRGLPDSVAYHELAGLDPDEVLGICEPNRYRKVFFLEPLPWVQDYARTESPETLDWLECRLREVYEVLGYPVVDVPALSIGERVALIRGHIENSAPGLPGPAPPTGWPLQ